MSTTARSKRGHRTARAVATGLVALGCWASVLAPTVLGSAASTDPGVAGPRGAVNGYGPGLGPQTPGRHWGGAYTLANVPGYGYCIEPGNADPVELPTDQWSPVAYPGSAVDSNGEMAALAYFAERYQGSGYPGWNADQTDAAIEQVAYASAGGTTPTASQGPAALVALIEQYIVTYAGPWTIALSMTPAPSSSFYTGTTYSGTITVTSATGNGVGGLQLTAPPTGGPGANQVSNFVWLAGTTNAAGQISFAWNISGVPPVFGGLFSAQGIDVVGGAVGTAPPTYAAPGGSGGQMMMVSGASELLGTSFGGLAVMPPSQTGTLTVQKQVPDAAYYGPGGAVFAVESLSGQVIETLVTDATGDAGPSVPLAVTGAGTLYRVHETSAPPGYSLAPDQLVTVHASPTPPAVVAFTGAHEEPALAAELGVAKVDATTHQPVAGATFDFKFDSQNNGVYDQDLGTCTTKATGGCQPAKKNTTGGWLAGWYEITETQAPPGYWLDPATTTKTVYVAPGAANVTTAM